MTGAVASKRVTEAPKGTLRMDGNHSKSATGRKDPVELDCSLILDFGNGCTAWAECIVTGKQIGRAHV